MPHFEKPAEGTWTEHYPGLGTEPVSFQDSYDPDYWQEEIDTIFKREWLNVGRVEQLPRAGSYFTRELPWAKRSIIVNRDEHGTIRAYYNVCRHRGNKLVWNDYPNEETAGTCRLFTCKYHGWQYGLDGALENVQQESEFFHLDKAALGLVAVACDVWEGFIFVNLDRNPKQTLAEALAPVAAGLDGYPFGEMTQTYSVRSEIDANWKLFIDAFVEFYHAPVLHQNQAVSEEGSRLNRYGFEGLHYELFSPHSMVASWGGIAPPKDPKMVKPLENILRAGLFGPWDKPELMKDRELPPMVNPSRHRAWGLDSWVLYPNFMILIWEPGWYMTYNYWPLGPSKLLFESTLNFVPPKNAQERIAQEMTFCSITEYVFQDMNTLEATQSMIESGVVDTFVLNDQEILCRHHHAVVRAHIEAGERPATYPWTTSSSTTGA